MIDVFQIQISNFKIEIFVRVYEITCYFIIEITELEITHYVMKIYRKFYFIL